MMKVIVAGTRTFSDYELLKQKIDFYLGDRKDVVIVSGKARGADSLGERDAKEKEFSIKEFARDWVWSKTVGRSSDQFIQKYGSVLKEF